MKAQRFSRTLMQVKFIFLPKRISYIILCFKNCLIIQYCSSHKHFTFILKEENKKALL